ncbi:hypothetical protein C8R45DRAFT_771134, partial [Mycena sanguinolenta]
RPSRSKKAVAERALDAAKDAASSDVEVIEQEMKRPQRVQVKWEKNTHWTDSLVQYLTDNPSFRKKLFSDSTAEAKAEKRPKLVANDGKAIQYGFLAQHIFESDPQEGACYNNNPAKYATSVESRIRRLKKEYQVLLKEVGATGAGMDPADIWKDSKLENIFDAIRKKWPWWDTLHAFWQELPNYNPAGVQSSEPGTDHAGAAADL